MINMYAVLLLCFASFLAPTTSKRYDVELEAVKLFGEDLNSVMARFRRTPEYLEIINDRFNELKSERYELGSYLFEVYRVKLIEKLSEMFGTNATASETAALRSRNTRGRSKWNLRRQSNGNQNDSYNLAEAVETLDRHPTLHSVLTVQERNNFKSVGFEIAGQLIDNVINGMKTGDEPLPSTQQPWGDNEIRNSTITSEHKHEVTSETPVTNETPVTIYANEQNTADNGGSTVAMRMF